MSSNIKVIGNDSTLGKILNSTYPTEKCPFVEVGPHQQVILKTYETYCNSIDNFDVRDEDVFVLSFPKTGTRWTEEMIWLLLNNLDFEKALEVPLFSRSILLELQTIYDLTPEKFSIKGLSKLPSPRIFKSHLQWCLLPKAISSGAKQPKIIVILREPEDTCTSSYYQAKIVEGFRGDWDQYCTLFLAGKILYGPYWKHVLGFWEQRHRSNILFIKFRKMKTDLSGTIREVAAFLGKNVSDNDVINLCNHLSFDNLKKSKGFNIDVHIKGDVNPYVRKGKVGDHKNCMSAEVMEEFRKQREQYLPGTGLSFD